MPGRLACLGLLIAMICGGGCTALAQDRAAPVIYSVTPLSGPVGTSITVTGAISFSQGGAKSSPPETREAVEARILREQSDGSFPQRKKTEVNLE